MYSDDAIGHYISVIYFKDSKNELEEPKIIDIT